MKIKNKIKINGLDVKLKEDTDDNVIFDLRKEKIREIIKIEDRFLFINKKPTYDFRIDEDEVITEIETFQKTLDISINKTNMLIKKRAELEEISKLKEEYWILYQEYSNIKERLKNYLKSENILFERKEKIEKEGYDNLLKYYKAIYAKEDFLYAVTKPIAYFYNSKLALLGDYDILLSRGELRIYGHDDTYKRPNFPHPHIGDNGYVCMGNMEKDIKDNIKDNNYIGILYNIYLLLSNINRKSMYPSGHIDNFATIEINATNLELTCLSKKEKKVILEKLGEQNV